MGSVSSAVLDNPCNSRCFHGQQERHADPGSVLCSHQAFLYTLCCEAVASRSGVTCGQTSHCHLLAQMPGSSEADNPPGRRRPAHSEGISSGIRVFLAASQEFFSLVHTPGFLQGQEPQATRPAEPTEADPGSAFVVGDPRAGHGEVAVVPVCAFSGSETTGSPRRGEEELRESARTVSRGIYLVLS